MNSQKVIHEPVLLKQVIQYLDIKPDGTYVDCTLGDGGYSNAIAAKLTDGKLISLDWDQQSIDFVKQHYKQSLRQKDWIIHKSNFADLENVLSSEGIESVDGIVFDLGLSSRQLDLPQRGFSFKFDTEIDMRMDQEMKVDANDLIKVVGRKQLTEIIGNFGEERYAGRIANAIKDWVDKNPNKDISARKLVDLIRRVVPASYRRGSSHPARRTFQALRIAVNDELNNLAVGVTSALSQLACNGNIVVVSYHSLEDRIVKQAFDRVIDRGDFKDLSDGVHTPSEQEIKLNPRSSSAKLRAANRVCK